MYRKKRTRTRVFQNVEMPSMNLIDLRKIRNHYNWTIVEMAEKLNMNPYSLQYIEEGRAEPSMFLLSKLRKLLLEN